jgi:hypothetical protein
MPRTNDSSSRPRANNSIQEGMSFCFAQVGVRLRRFVLGGAALAGVAVAEAGAGADTATVAEAGAGAETAAVAEAGAGAETATVAEHGTTAAGETAVSIR